MAAQNLRQRLQTRSLAGQVGDLSGLTRFSEAADIWLARVREMVADGRRSPGTLESYERQLVNHVNPAMGGVRLGEGPPRWWTGCSPTYAGESVRRLQRSDER